MRNKGMPTPNKKQPKVKVLTLEKIRKIKIRSTGNPKPKMKTNQEIYPKMKDDPKVKDDLPMLHVLDKGSNISQVRNFSCFETDKHPQGEEL